MKTIKVRPVLVESKESTLHLSHGKLLITTIESTGKSDLYKSIPQELILISLENEKIEEGDWKYNPRLNKIWQHNRKNKSLSEDLQNIVSNDTVKVIARQSQIPLEYISKFIEQYNNDCVDDLEIEMEDCGSYEEFLDFCGKLGYDYDGAFGWYKRTDPGGNRPNTSTLEDLFNKYPKLTNGFVMIVEKDPIKLEDGWEAKLAIKNIPYLEHTINSLKDLRRYYIDGIQVGYQARKSEEPISYTEGEVLNLLHKLEFDKNTKEFDKNINLAAWFEQNKKK